MKNLLDKCFNSVKKNLNPLNIFLATASTFVYFGTIFSMLVPIGIDSPSLTSTFLSIFSLPWFFFYVYHVFKNSKHLFASLFTFSSYLLNRKKFKDKIDFLSEYENSNDFSSHLDKTLPMTILLTSFWLVYTNPILYQLIINSIGFVGEIILTLTLLYSVDKGILSKGITSLKNLTLHNKKRKYSGQGKSNYKLDSKKSFTKNIQTDEEFVSIITEIKDLSLNLLDEPCKISAEEKSIITKILNEEVPLILNQYNELSDAGKLEYKNRIVQILHLQKKKLEKISKDIPNLKMEKTLKMLEKNYSD